MLFERFIELKKVTLGITFLNSYIRMNNNFLEDLYSEKLRKASSIQELKEIFESMKITLKNDYRTFERLNSYKNHIKEKLLRNWYDIIHRFDY